MRAALDPPRGVSARLAGLPVLASGRGGLASSVPDRLLMLVIGLVVVGLVLLAALRRWRRALIPLVPIVLATGWSALLVYALRIPAEPDVGDARNARYRGHDRVQRAAVRARAAGS